MKKTTLLIIFSIILGSPLSNMVYAKDLLTISKIVNKLKKSNEYKIQDENIKQSDYLVNGVDGILDGKVSTKFFKYSSKNYPNPPISLDSKKEGYGLSVDYEKMTPYGFKFGLGFGFEDKELGTTPSNTQFSLDAMDSVYRASIVVPLLRNFRSREYHFKKAAASRQNDGLKLKTKNEKHKLISESIGVYWSIVKLMQEKEIAQSSVARFKSLHKFNRVKKRSGIISNAELLTSGVEVINREKSVKDIISKIDIEQNKLKTLIEEDGLIAVSVEKMMITDSLLNMSDGEVEGLIESGLVHSQFQSNMELSNSLLEIEKEATKSKVDLFLSAKSFGRGSGFNESIEENSQDKYEVYAGVSWAFDVDSSKNSNNLGRALSQKRQAILREKQASLKLRNGFSEIVDMIKSNLEQITYLKKIRNQQQKILKVERKRFKNGKISTLDYVKSQESYDKSSLQIIGLNYFNEVIALKLFTTIGKLDLYLSNYFKKASL